MVSLALSAILASQPTIQSSSPIRPKLVVVISIDQFRGDYTTRFADHYLPAQNGGKVGGFNYLTQRGAFYPDGQYNHVPTETGPVGQVDVLRQRPIFNNRRGKQRADESEKPTCHNSWR